MNDGILASHVKDPARLAALHAVALLDTPTEEAFDRLSRLAVAFVDAPVALVSLVDADRQFFKSCIGLPEPWGSRRETPLSHSFCQHNRIPGQPLLIEDARTHPLFQDNPSIVELNAIAYLGIPLVTSDGYVLGSFCVIDSKPRQWTQKDIAVIQDLAASVMTEIHLRTEIAAHKLSEDRCQDLMGMVEQRTLELQEKQLQCLHSEKLAAIGQLSASIAHEFNSPLQTVMTVLKVLEGVEILKEEDKMLLNAAIGESNRMKKLIRSLGDFNRPSSGVKVMVDIHSIIDSVLLLSTSDFRRRGISMMLNCAQRLPQIMVVPDQIKQVVINLLSNAADACQKNGGVITISTWQVKQRIAVAIQDNGVGIASDKIDMIFRPFYTTKPEVKGTGLGLSICHGIVKKHKGEIRVVSEPGNGSTFTVLLPLDGEVQGDAEQ